jgi:hypothetical protein
MAFLGVRNKASYPCLTKASSVEVFSRYGRPGGLRIYHNRDVQSLIKGVEVWEKSAAMISKFRDGIFMGRV